MLHLDAVPKPVAVLLRRLRGHSALTGFALGGGTALALRAGHRLSVDLDYFTEDEFSTGALFEALGLEGATAVAVSRNSLTLDAGGVKVDLLRHAYPQLAPVEKIDGMALVSLPDLAAMKLNAITNRGSKKDFYDVAELLASYPLTKLLDFFSRKYAATDAFAVIRSLAWFEDADAEPDPVSLTGHTWEEIKGRIVKSISEL